MDTAKEPKRCGNCGAALAENSSDALCAGCVLQAALFGPSEDLDAPDALGEGRKLGSYEIIGEIARGGMGIVFRARQKRPDRIVALKVIAVGELATPRMVERFKTEAEAAARLDHPHIVPIYEVGHEAGWHYFSMRLIDGCTLAEKVRSEPLHPQAAVALMIKVSQAVEHAHQRGVLHRDLKPNNILLDGNGEPHLTDFGLAKMVESRVELTMSNVVLGTPAYMAPEQATGGTRDITVSADIYGLGAVLYELLTGRPPFVAATPHALLRQVVEDDPVPPSHINRARRKSSLLRAVKALPDKRHGVDQILASSAAANTLLTDLDAICLKCLEKDPARRYHSTEQLVEDLERASRGETISAKASTATQRLRKWVRRNPAPAVAVSIAFLALIVITAGSLLFSIRLNRSRAVAEGKAHENLVQLIRQHTRESATYAMNGDALTSLPYLVAALELSKAAPEFASGLRRRIGLITDWSPRTVRAWDAGGNPIALRFSADGEHLIATVKDSYPRIWRIRDNTPLLGPDATAKPGNLISAIPSPNGNLILEISKETPFARVRDYAKETVLPLALDGPLNTGAFSGDGKIVVTAGRTVRVWNSFDGSAAGPEIPMKAFYAVLSGKGDKLLLVQDAKEASLWESSSGRPVGAPIAARHAGEFAALTFNDQGTRVFVSNIEEALVMRVKDFTPEYALKHPGILFQAVFSPDRDFFATASLRGGAEVWDLALGNPTPRQILHENGAFAVTFSPDGQAVASGGFDYRLRVSRSPDLRPLAPSLPHTALVGAAAFSPDGRLLASGSAEGTVRLWDLSGGGLSLLGIGRDTPPIFNPLGTAFAMALTNSEWQIFHLEGSTIRTGPVVTGAGTDLLAWGTKGSLALADASGVIRIFDSKTGEQKREVIAPGSVRAYEFGPDESYLAVSATPKWVGTISLMDERATALAQYHGRACTVLRLSPDGTRLVTADQGSWDLWDRTTGKIISSGDNSKGRVNNIQFSPDGRRFIIGFLDFNIDPAEALMFDSKSGQRVGHPMQHGDGVQGVVYSPDGKRVATPGQDNSVRLWSAEDGSPAAPAMHHDFAVRLAAFSPDGKYLATGASDLRFWDAATGELMAPPLNFAYMTAVSFSPDGHKIVFGARGGSVWAMDFRTDERSISELAVTSMLSTGHRLDPSVGLIRVSAEELEKAQRTAGLPDIFAENSRVTWHRSQISWAEARSNAFAKAFHLKQLQKLEKPR